MSRSHDLRSSRRSFLQTSALAGAGVWIPNSMPGRSPIRAGRYDKLNVAAIGCGGKGYSDAKAMAGENIVALCDVDLQRGARLMKEFPDARVYSDYREMLDKERDLHAVTVSTPDHTHAVAAVAAMQRGLHVYVQKPLTHSVEEARVLRLIAQRTGVVTQMGNQGTAHDGMREALEIVKSGVIGAVREVHVWTNRPVWPQGNEAPTEAEAIPKTLRWDLWLGPAKHRSYNKAYGAFVWRGFWDFGTGAIGDMACHTLNLPYFALELGAPTHIEAESDGMTEAMAPKSAKVHYKFPARGELPPVDLHWYSGSNKPATPWLPDGMKLTNSGSVMIGDRGILYSPGDYGTQYRLLPQADFEGFEKPAPFLRRSSGIHKEWIEAIKGGPQPLSHFGNAGPFTETALLGNVAIRAGVPLEWDTVSMRIPNAPEAERFLRDHYSYGYDIGL